MEYEGLEKLYQYVLKIQPKINTFVDIGSGRGKLCMYMAAKPNIKQSLGIELVEGRHKDAMQLKTMLKSEYSDKVEFLNADIFTVNFASEISVNNALLWFSNLCFDPNITQRIFEKVKAEFPIRTIIASSKGINSDIVGLSLIDNITVPMSWFKNSNVHIYEIVA